jgi:tRNA 2-thiouridine synthesizing protein A
VKINDKDAVLLDTQGLYCPEPIMLLHSKIDSLSVGDTCYVIASDPATKRDIPKFCQFLGHILISEEEVGETFTYLIQKC